MVINAQQFPNLGLETRVIASEVVAGLQSLSMPRSSQSTPFFTQLRQWADEAGLSMNQLAREIDKSSAAIRKWRLGIAKPTLATRKRLAQVLKRPLSDFLDELSEAELAELGEDDFSDDVYRSLGEFLGEHTDLRITSEELYWLSSQRFADELGDIGDHEWWIGQLIRYRGLMKRRAAPPGGPQPSPKRSPGRQARG